MVDERDRRRGRHHDHGRVRTPAGGVPVATINLADIDDTDELTPPPQLLEELMDDVGRRVSLSPRERLLISAITARMLDRIGKVHRLSTDRLLQVQQAAPASDRTQVRIAELEVWRGEMIRWRLQISGVADGNGRLGQLTRVVEGIREDVGDSRECAAVRTSSGAVRALQRRAWAAVVAAATAVGGSGYGLLRSRDENIAAAALAAERLERLERDVVRNRAELDLLRFPRRFPAPSPEPAREP